MGKLDIADVTRYVEENISVFKEKRIKRLKSLSLKTILRKKNPYLFKAKSMLTAEEIVRALTDAFISSNEETIFGDWLEGLAIFINEKVYDGKKSGITGIDLEFDKNNVRYIVAIKSGPNWGNSSQIRKMVSDFKSARKRIRTSNSGILVCAVNGCCYGKNSKTDKGDYFKYCGQTFWKFISNNENLYTDIIEPLGYKAKERNADFQEKYVKMVNKFTRTFVNDFCFKSGGINWKKLVKFNSGESANY